jgi:hypothetical protein
MGSVNESVLSIASTPLAHMAGFIAGDAGVSAGLADRADLAAGESRASRASGAAGGDQR